MTTIVCSRPECQTTAGCKCLDREVSLFGYPRVIDRKDAEITSLRAQVEELRRERDANARDGYLCGQRLADMEARATAAEAEAERLRGLIRANWTGNCWRAVNDHQQDEIRAALSEKSDG